MGENAEARTIALRARANRQRARKESVVQWIPNTHTCSLGCPLEEPGRASRGLWSLVSKADSLLSLTPDLEVEGAGLPSDENSAHTQGSHKRYMWLVG